MFSPVMYDGEAPSHEDKLKALRTGEWMALRMHEGRRASEFARVESTSTREEGIRGAAAHM